ncbi:TetR/AcrR family transcriptional regulator [Ketobacter sp. MCCC 1A13808]|uniref:TetR/AcrR family transcriptional regulator n=1 Tax=Ketobacter sp. MCCC 1A13808 TaxID=2602738 RepID=UPI000F11EA58|nr:TetR/AcrR family transcriptional regulator [Ketobacter sp. MCCC 1A13808]MVF14571.1 TetR/AcrR family transcriptional regulator [Ketobacter sp. MCCC 1A13808]RLP54181.1 MAG: TetR/AcrR family transcriptional regulator [Ketobacter sp.]
MEQETHQTNDPSFVDVLIKATQKELGDAKSQFNFPMPGEGAKADVLFNSIEVFTSKGIEDTTVQDLLDAANISRRTFYKYFKNKVDVLESIYQMAAELLMIRFKSVQNEAATMSDFIVRCVELYFDYHTHLGPLVRMMTEEARRADSPLATHRATLLQHIVEMFEEKYYEFENINLDPKIYYSLIWMMESASMNLLSKLPCDQAEVDEFKAVMCAITARVAFTDPAQWSSLPKMPLKA